jgi:GAF domain-containing protein
MKNQFIKRHITAIYLLFTIIIILIFFFGIYVRNKNNTFEYYKKQQFKELDKIENYVNIIYSQSISKLNSAERIFKDITEHFETPAINYNDTITINLIEKNQSRAFKLPVLSFNNKPIYLQNDICNRITYISNVYASIWQKTDFGYIRIASSIPGISNEDIPEIIENSSQIVKKLNAGTYFTEKLFLSNDIQLNHYAPIYIKGKISAYLQLSVYEFITSSLNKLYTKKSTQFFLTDINNQKLFLSSSIISSNVYEHLLTELNQNNTKTIFFEHKQIGFFVNQIPEQQLYIGIIDSYSDYYSEQKKIKYKWLISGLSVTLLITALYFFIIIPYQKRKNHFINQIIKTIHKDEKNDSQSALSQIQVIEQLQNYYQNIVLNFEKLNSGNVDNQLSIIVADDELGNQIKQLQQSIIKNEQQKLIQQAEDELNEEFKKGNAQISAILQHINELDELSFQILKSIVDFFQLQQGGLFIVNDNYLKNTVLEMKASYAYNKKRLTDKVFSVNEGLVGRAFLEKESIYITEVPKKYTLIESGFGEQEPQFLLIVPLIFNNKVEAVIELAGIKQIDNQKIKFIEEIGEYIASTISNLKHSKQTEELLKQTRLQSKEIEEQRQTLEEKINTHRKQNRNLDKEILELIEIIESIKSVTFMIEYDLTGKIVDVSKKTLDLFAVTKKDIILLSHNDIVKTSDYNAEYKNFWEDLNENKGKAITEILYLNGKEIRLAQNYVPIRNVRRKIFRILSIGTVYN